MNAIGMDVSKGKSMVAILRPYGEIVSKPFEVRHSVSELNSLIQLILSVEGESRTVMEHTGRYYEPLIREFFKAGLFVSAINPKLIKDFDDNSLRKVKYDKADAVKIARYDLDSWTDLKQYSLMDEIRSQLKTMKRQFDFYMKHKTAMKNNLIGILDQTYPGANAYFDSPCCTDDTLIIYRFGTDKKRCAAYCDAENNAEQKSRLISCKKSDGIFRTDSGYRRKNLFLQIIRAADEGRYTLCPLRVLFVQNQCDKFKRFIACILERMSLTGSREGNVSRAHRNNGAVVVKFPFAAVNIIRFRFVFMNMIADRTSGLQCTVGKNTSFLVHFFGITQQMAHGDISCAVKGSGFLFNGSFVAFSYHRDSSILSVPVYSGCRHTFRLF